MTKSYCPGKWLHSGSVRRCILTLYSANLSNDYFTNRQDRYHLFSSKAITDYFYSIHSTVSQLSYSIMPVPYHENGYVLAWPETNLAPGPIFEPKAYIKKTSTILSQLIKPQNASSTTAAPNSSPDQKPNTIVYPISQLTPLLRPDTSTELPAITHILKTLSAPTYSNSSWTFTAGYFNPDPSLTSLLLSATSTNNTVITAHPHANGFFGSKGVSGLLPGAYTLLSRRFLDAAHKRNRLSSITLREWKKGQVNEPGGWTYHAKGLWIALNGEKEPSISVVGSSNYTKRSYKLDLEVGGIILTGDEGLKRRLREERDGLGGENTRVVEREDFNRAEKRVGIKVRVAMWIVSLVGGAL
jgi:CDP-diacylglycerol--glycerol-3-phosphate 3-phosphatidyltransferase